MNILESLEVRWFLHADHQTPEDWRKWYETATAEGKRVDHYLSTQREDLGFKARLIEGQPAKVETKILLGSLGAVQIAIGAMGTIERWKKLSLALDDAQLQRDGNWLAVEKDRRLRKYAFVAGCVAEVDAGTKPETGCSVELTQLRFHRGGGDCVEWTLGFEAFGPEPLLLDVLLATCRAVFNAQTSPIELRGDWSRSYPAWHKQMK